MLVTAEFLTIDKLDANQEFLVLTAVAKPTF